MALTQGMSVDEAVASDAKGLEKLAPEGCLVQGGTGGRRYRDRRIYVLPVVMGK